MDKKQRLIKLYEGEMEKARKIKEDIDSLGNMTDEQLLALVEKAQNFSRVLEKNWEQISGNDIKRKDVLPVLLRRKELKTDFTKIHQIEDEIEVLNQDLDQAEQEIKKQHKVKKQERDSQQNKMILTVSFGIMFICALCFHLIMLKRYHYIIMPVFLIMTILPLFLCILNALFLKKALDASSADIAEQELEQKRSLIQRDIEEKQELLQFYDQKYQNVFEDLDEYQMEAYPYVEQIVHKLEYRENYRRAQNEYCGIIEILHFKQPDVYLFVPEIFLVEEEMQEFLHRIQEKMRKLDEYLVQTIETA
ncbi:MAG: hypothetical protein Q4E73_04925 [Lachnospiraceae bacterium]|nr:hypothetical protein [Lachnospiraceae bacterium]